MTEDGESEIGRGNGRKVQQRRARRNAFNKARRQTFLRHFAATCNVTASAAAAGVGLSTVYVRRNADPQFRAAWAAAQDQGYVALEAALVQRALDAARAVEPDEQAANANYHIPFKEALALLQHHGRSLGKMPGDTIPRRSDLGEATKRLEGVLKRLKVVPEGADEQRGR
jgi:hypothetical protein